MAYTLVGIPFLKWICQTKKQKRQMEKWRSSTATTPHNILLNNGIVYQENDKKTHTLLTFFSHFLPCCLGYISSTLAVLYYIYNEIAVMPSGDGRHSAQGVGVSLRVALAHSHLSISISMSMLIKFVVVVCEVYLNKLHLLETYYNI